MQTKQSTKQKKNNKKADYGWKREKQAASEKKQSKNIQNNPMNNIHARHDRAAKRKQRKRPTGKTNKDEPRKNTRRKNSRIWFHLLFSRVFVSISYPVVLSICPSLMQMRIQNNLCIAGVAVLTEERMLCVRLLEYFFLLLFAPRFLGRLENNTAASSVVDWLLVECCANSFIKDSFQSFLC